MDRYYSPAQVAEIMSISRRSAYDKMHKMPHLESPLRVSERVLKDYLEQNTVYPVRPRSGRRTA